MTVTLILVALSMAVRDVLGTLLVIAEAKCKPVAAGALDAAGDVAQAGCYILGLGEIILHGWGWAAAEILATMCVTSFVTTWAATLYGTRWVDAQDRPRPV